MNHRLSSVRGMRLRIFALAALAALPALARSTGAPPGRTGAPPGDVCTACHQGTVNSGSGSVKIEFSNGSTYKPGEVYKLKVTVADPNARRWGFELTARMGTEKLEKTGTFAIAEPARTQFSPGSAAGEYVTHTSAGTSPGTSGSSSWEVNWTAPAAGTGPVTFYAAGNAADNSGTNSGDSIYTTSVAVAEASATTVTGKSYILPQFAYGDGWYSALYFSNTTDTPAAIGVDFYAKNGSSLSVPLAGMGPVSNYTATIPAKGTVILEAPNAGNLQEGWAKATLPPGVTGYGIFRQSSSGRADQEAVVPLSEDSRQAANLIWDETAFTTAVAVVNPADQAVTVSISVYDNGGTQIGTVALNLGAHAREAFILSGQPGLAGVTSKRGLARLSVPAGSLAVLGLRFGGEAFTSIPVDYP